MATGDLTTLADVKAWLGRTDSNSDTVLSALITRASRQILSRLERSTILPHSVSEVRDGSGGTTLVLKQWPVVSVESVAIGEHVISPIPQGSNGCGWMLEPWDGTPPGRPQTLALRGLRFGEAFPGARPDQRVHIVYCAGYQVTDEAQTVVSAMATVDAPFGPWACDLGVTYASGAALEKVSSAPDIGEYALAASPGVYEFNPGDNGAEVLISYGFIPTELGDACIELVAERFKYSERIGERSHALGGNETVSFDSTRLTPLVAGMLQPFRRTIPV